MQSRPRMSEREEPGGLPALSRDEMTQLVRLARMVKGQKLDQLRVRVNRRSEVLVLYPEQRIQCEG